MSRSLRPRTSRPSYATLFEIASDDEAPIPIDDGSSSDEFEPQNDPENEAAAEDEDEESAAESSEGEGARNESNDDNDVVIIREPPSKKYGQKAKSTKTTSSSSPSRAVHTVGAALTRPSTRQPPTVPAPSVDHRHRAIPIYRESYRVERLASKPKLFGPAEVVSTNNWSLNNSITDRYNKSSAQNAGPGPVWELMEDRACWKESLPVPDGEMESEATRRPRVHGNVKVHMSLKILNNREAVDYFPSEPGASNPTPTSVRCSFGLIGQQTQKEVRMLESLKMSEFLPDANAHVFNAGAPVWGLDWCPIYVEDHLYRSFKQYIAVAPLPSRSHSPEVGVKCNTPFPACIQIWSLGPTTKASPPQTRRMSGSPKGKEKAVDENDFGQMCCEMIVCVDCGPALELKWCPLPSHDSWFNEYTGGTRKLGILAGVFEDGSLSIFVIPDPEDIRVKSDEPISYVKLEPTLRIMLEETAVQTFDWANSDRIAIGCSNGSFAVYDLKDAFRDVDHEDLLPTHYIQVHQSAVCSIQWIRIPPPSADDTPQKNIDPTTIASGGYDGCEVLTDLREGIGNEINRTRDVSHAMSFSTYAVGPMTIDHENTVKVYSLCPVMFGRGHLVAEAGGPIWSLHASDYHGQLAIGAADGTVLTTNLLKSTRRSSASPSLFYKVFQLDYNRNTGEYRMLEQFLPQEVPDRSGSRNKPKKPTGLQIPAPGTGVWPAEVSVTRVVWNQAGGLARAQLLASATASGLCRIDWLQGWFFRNRVPYNGVEFIRNEVEGDVEKMDEDEED